jgi:hypothetical protein
MVRPKRAPAPTGAPTAGLRTSTSTSASLATASTSSEQPNEKAPTTRRKKASLTSQDQEVAALIDTCVKEPRKRRIASLNAEFLVHYCSSNNNNPNGNAQASTHATNQAQLATNNRYSFFHFIL